MPLTRSITAATLQRPQVAAVPERSRTLQQHPLHLSPLTIVQARPTSSVNAPAVDEHGTVYANSEDGSLYRIGQGHRGVFTQPDGKLFLGGALGAAYTPLSIADDGRIVTQDLGQLFVVGGRREE